MVATPFEPKQKEISDKVHRDYRVMLYPPMFGVLPGDIIYDNLPEDFREAADRHIATDCILDVKYKGLRSAMRFLISYRFRDADQYQSYQDVTFTEHNHASDLPSELYHMAVQYFTYGYYDSEHRLVEAVIVDIPELKKAIIRGTIQPTHENVPNFRSQQTFVSYSFDDLKRLGLIIRHFKEVDGVLVSQKWRRPS